MDNQDQSKPKLSLGSRPTLGLGNTTSRTGTTTKTVTVEVKKKRSVEVDLKSGAKRPELQIKAPQLQSLNLSRKPKNSIDPQPDQSFHQHDDDQLTETERKRREVVLAMAKDREAELQAKRAEQQIIEAQQRQAEEQAQKLKEEKELETPVIPSAPVKTLEASAPKTDKTPLAPKPIIPNKTAAEDDNFAGGKLKRSKLQLKDKAPSTFGKEHKAGRITIQEALSDDDNRMRSLASIKRKREKEKQRMTEDRASAKKILREVIVPETITVQELASRMAERATDVVRVLMRLGVMATVNQSIDADTAELVVSEMGHQVKRVTETDAVDDILSYDPGSAVMKPRAPVVTIMGHVDHGKTSLLDALRQTNVVSTEAGGITQHIGAYQITLKDGKKISFIDTPGHAAFTEMRARGANVTDIVVLVVAADDGIMPQTIEAISHAKAAQVPLIVAVNKIDKPDANPGRVYTELLSHELVVESMGGDVQTVEISAKQRTNLDKLLEAISLQAEILDLKADIACPAKGIVVEAKMEKGRGSVASVLIQRGFLQTGDIFVSGSEWGKVRALHNDQGLKITKAGPSEPVEVLGFDGTPLAGDDFIVLKSEDQAREIASFRAHKKREKALSLNKGTLDQMFASIKEGGVKELAVILRGDVQGSLEAIAGSLQKLATDEVKVKILHKSVGAISESDITLASASQAVIIGFNVRAGANAKAMAERDKIDIRYYSIIYELVDDIKGLMSGLLKPEEREKFLGYATILEVFNITKVGKVSGCKITSGTVKRGAKVRLLRDKVVIHEGVLKSLRRFKDEVKEVSSGMECGMAFENYSDIQAGDEIECFEVEVIERSI